LKLNYAEVVSSTNEIIEEYSVPLTVRQTYYRLISPPFQLFANNLNNYKGFDKILTRARERGDIDWRRLEDRARSTIGVACRLFGTQTRVVTSMSDFEYCWNSGEHYLNTVLDELKNCHNDFGLSMWETQPQYMEVWVEKDALASLFSTVARGFRVIVFPSRGYSSLTKIKEAVEDRFMERIKHGQYIGVLHFTDHDPSGLNMTSDINKRLGEYLKHALIKLDEDDHETFKQIINKINTNKKSLCQITRCALTYEQVKWFNLASNPTKLSDSRAKEYNVKYGDECWELDALPPDELQKIIRSAIIDSIDSKAWTARQNLIEQERSALQAKLQKLKISFE
jgi:5S rRNA maturation endonuclease (ribonuclease M5)